MVTWWLCQEVNSTVTTLLCYIFKKTYRELFFFFW